MLLLLGVRARRALRKSIAHALLEVADAVCRSSRLCRRGVAFAARRRWGSGLLLGGPRRRGSSLRLVEALKPRDIALHFANKNCADEIFRRKHAGLRAEFPERPGHLDFYGRPFHAPVGADADLPSGVGLRAEKIEISLHPHRAVPATERSAADVQHSVVDRERDLETAELEISRLDRLKRLFLDRVFREGQLHR